MSSAPQAAEDTLPMDRMSECSDAAGMPESSLPPKPEMPDCCNGGCAVCVLEGYDEEVQRWEEQVAAILKRREQHNKP